MTNSIYIIAGPTGIGKSEFSLSLARQVKGSIINADSMQIYKNLKILTARPIKKEMSNIEHHLYGYIDGSERYNVEKWCNDASNIILENFNNDITPVLVGGTSLYINTLINGITDIPKISEDIKIESEKIIKELGKEFLISQIKKNDPESLKNINLNDTIRLRRVWEVFESTGKKFSEWKLNKTKKFLNNYNFKILLFLPNREKNYEFVNSRFIKMINSGAVEEVRKLLDLDLHHSLPIMRAHGVPEIKNFLEKKISLDECISKGQQVTRNYVKRQHTWWNSSKLPILQKFDKFPSEMDIKTIKID